MRKTTSAAALRALVGGMVFLLAGAAAKPARAEFAIAVAPPRFELDAKPGERIRRTLDITNAGSAPAKLTVRTADWVYGQDGGVTFLEPLSPGSCRPWVAIERREVTVGAGRNYRFRFEVAPPADAPKEECRFAILIEGTGDSLGAAGLPIAFNGRVAIIVYLAVGDVKPKLEVLGGEVRNVDGQPTAVLRVRNSGTAHGRLEGFLSGVDAAGTSLDFAPSNAPILPDEVRVIPLVPTRRGDPETRVAPAFPVTVKGKLEWGKSESQDIEQRFGP
ncbi:MAG TPA: hypothetical protein VHA82_06505 [Ramlibacter sp.]|uniref:COG1470 family protein n=1 Tax=Ramlibacter sp. TaxID=1917967 RepID=UPI002C65B4AF|nr:hypothetical protein [Ramlibacter sp.]HVZ43446.1 hypothetical protein [Ramlibacter sp.]